MLNSAEFAWAYIKPKIRKRLTEKPRQNWTEPEFVTAVQEVSDGMPPQTMKNLVRANHAYMRKFLIDHTDPRSDGDIHDF